MLWSFSLPKHLLDPLVVKKCFKFKNVEISDSLQNQTEMGFLLHVYTHAHVHTKIWQHKPNFIFEDATQCEDTRPCSVLQRKIPKGSGPNETVKSQIWVVLVLTLPGRTVRTR